MTVKTVFLLFNTGMMDGPSYRQISDVKVKIEDGNGNTFIKDTAANDAIGSGFYPTNFSQASNRLTITIYNAKSSSTLKVRLDAVHLYDEPNLMNEFTELNTWLTRPNNSDPDNYPFTVS